VTAAAESRVRSTDQPLQRGKAFRDAPNYKGLDRVLVVVADVDGRVMCNEHGTSLYPWVQRDRLLDRFQFEPVDLEAAA
jgi:hypothetical protein